MGPDYTAGPGRRNAACQLRSARIDLSEGHGDAATMSQSSDLSPADLSVDLAGLSMANPLMTASGTSGYGAEYAAFLDVRKLGAFVTKAVTIKPRKGNPPPRTYETRSGMLNAIGLANLGLHAFLDEKVPYLQTLGIPVIVNVAGHTVADYVEVCRALDAVPCISGVELNVSCPNVSDGLEFGTDPGRLAALVAEVRQTVQRACLIVKLSPNVTDIAACARAAVDGGAEVLSVINTLRGMAIRTDTWRPVLANVVGGLSGPAIKPVALFMVHAVYSRIAAEAGVPIIGMGGIESWQDAVEFHLAGATALAIGTALFVDPTIPLQICDGLRHYLAERGLSSVQELIGQLRLDATNRPAGYQGSDKPCG
jgi:dihydroorotate dehydrogenase (NAD+) catalytic subunit